MASTTRLGTRYRPVVLVLVCLLFAACRKGEAGGVSSLVPIVSTPRASYGCNGPNQAFVMPMAVYSDAAIGPLSQIAAPRDTDPMTTLESLFLTGEDGSIRELDFSGGAPPVETVHIAPGVIDGLLAAAGIGMPAQISGIGIIDSVDLVIADHTSNTLILAELLTPSVYFFAGFPDTNGGFADGFGDMVRFNFTEPGALIITNDDSVYVADTGNDAIRRVSSFGLPIVETIAGTGAPFFRDGDLAATGFDTPVGLSASCGGELLIVESGGASVAGNRLRSLAVGMPSFFGTLEGSSTTLAGDGTDATVEGMGATASLAAPRGLSSTSQGEIYWIDSTTGILRRYSMATGISDCPLFPDCATAVATCGCFTPGGNFSMAVTEGGVLYVLDADAETIFRLSP